ncbi:hypothetical protein H0H92_006072 [Tricholoma furcatifolium]|nr:hypothetical protein H0H92_006072 [Tricholoma furcatifolium]
MIAGSSTISEPPGPLEDERDGTDTTAFSKIPEDKPKRKRTRNNGMVVHHISNIYSRLVSDEIYSTGTPQEVAQLLRIVLAWLYTLFLAIDANFKLRLKNRGLSDTELAPGWAYYIEDSAYQKHLKNYVNQPESQELLTLTTSHPQINTCQSEHDAIARANSRHLPGHLVSGTGLVLCARHALICRNGVADLTKGENSFKADRYCTMDYIALMTLVQSSILYWGKNLQTRAADYPENLMAAANKIKWTALVPRWHIMVHGDECQTEHSLNYEQGCLREAVAMQDKHRTVVAKLTQTFSPQKIEEWSRMIEEWKMDRKKPQNEWVKDNPYAEPTKVANLHEVKCELAKEEAEQAAEGVLPLHEKIGPTKFVSLGLELESQQ